MIACQCSTGAGIHQKALLAIAVDFDAQDLYGRPQIVQFEVFGEISNDLLDCIKRL